MSAADELVGAIDARLDDAVDLLKQLVAIPSPTPTLPGLEPGLGAGGESRVNDVLAERYALAGLETHRVAPDPGRSNLVGVLAGSGGGRSLALNAHVDTVAPVDPEGWLCGGPWKPEIRDGRLYGLGSTDMKGGGTAMWVVAQALNDAGIRLQGDLQLHSVVGEEMMEHELGTTAVIEAGFRTDGAIVTEPTSFPKPLTVSTIAAGVLLLRIGVAGKATHAGNRSLAIRPGGPGDAIGVNALEKAMRIVQATLELEQQWGMRKSHPSFPPGFFTIGANILHADAGLPFPAYFPDQARIEYVVWYPPQEAADDVRSEIEQHVRAACATDPWLVDHPPAFEWLLNWPPMDTPWQHPLTQAMRRAHERINGQPVADPSPATPVNFGAASDATWYEHAGIPAIVYGPGDLTIAHCKDEHVLVDEVFAAARALGVAVLDWCGVAA